MAALKTLFLAPTKGFNHISIRFFAAPKASIGKKRFRLPVEKDPERLVNYVCGSNIYKDGEDIKLKDDSEYPEWIWKMKIHAPPRVDDYDPKSKEYWEFCEIQHVFRTYRLQGNRPKVSMTIGKAEKTYEERILRARARAILPESIDHGYDPKDILEEPVDPRIHLKPEMDETIVPFDQAVLPKHFDKLSFYRQSTKPSVLSKNYVEEYSIRPRWRKPKYI